MSVKLNVKVKTESLKVYTLIVDYTFFFKVSITRMHCLKVRDLEEIVTPQVFEEIHDGEKKKKGQQRVCVSPVGMYHSTYAAS